MRIAIRFFLQQLEQLMGSENNGEARTLCIGSPLTEQSVLHLIVLVLVSAEEDDIWISEGFTCSATLESHIVDCVDDTLSLVSGDLLNPTMLKNDGLEAFLEEVFQTTARALGKIASIKGSRS